MTYLLSLFYTALEYWVVEFIVRGKVSFGWSLSAKKPIAILHERASQLVVP